MVKNRVGEPMSPLYDEIYKLAVEVGCRPFWYDGMFGPAWHCGCVDNRHACDQQCSMITFRSLRPTVNQRRTA
jgi:hypothetical protein